MPNMKHLGRYEILNNIGSGSYADVYRAHDAVLNQVVALKVLKPALIADAEAVRRFIKEGQTASGLFHNQIATVMNLGEEDGYIYMAMRYVDGKSLDQLINEDGRIPWEQAHMITNQVGDALAFAHDRGFVHRDVKPKNILINDRDGAVLTDFGLVRAIEASNEGTRSGSILGTPGYIAPEIWDGKPPTPASDQYSLACVLVEMLSGKMLFGGTNPWEVVKRHSQPLNLGEKLPAGLPPGLKPILEKALESAPEKRYKTLEEFLKELSGLGESGDGDPKDKPPAQPWVWGLVGALVVTLLALVYLLGKGGSVDGGATGQTLPTMPPGTGPTLTLTNPGNGVSTQQLSEYSGMINNQAIENIRPGEYLEYSNLGLYFSSDRDGRFEIYRLGSGITLRLTNTPGLKDSWDAIPLRNGSFFFVSNRTGKKEIYWFAMDGKVTQVTNTPGIAESWGPVPLSDGSILFNSNRSGKTEIHQINKTGEIIQFSHTPGTGESWNPVVSQDGKVWFNSDRDGKLEIYLLDEGKTNRVTHTSGQGSSWDAALMKNNSIFFTSNRDGKNEIYRLLTSSAILRVTNTPGSYESWNPIPTTDGSLTFNSSLGGTPQILMVDPSGITIRMTQNGENWLNRLEMEYVRQVLARQ